MADFTPSKPIGRSNEPDSPLHDKEPDKADAAADATCTYQGSTYSKGATICINHDTYQCGNNGWFKNGGKC